MSKAKSFLKKTLKVVLRVVLTIVTIFILAAAIIQIPGIQNRIVQYATSFVSNKTHTRVEIKNISISFPKAVVIEGLFLEDLKKDTLLYAGKVKINIALFDLLSDKISINSFALDGANLNLCRTKADSLFNFSFLLAAFSDTTNQTKVKPQSPSKWTFSIDRVNLKNIRFHYDDEYGGMNVTAVLGNLKLTINEIDFGKSICGMDELMIEDLKANVLIKKTAIVSEKKFDGILPKISVNKVQVNNSTVKYGDSISNQSANAVIKLFRLKHGSIGLQTKAAFEPPVNNWRVRVESILLDADFLAYQVGNKPEIKNAFDVNLQEYSHVMLNASTVNISSDTVNVSVKMFSATDRNNFSITKFETDFSMDQHSITAKNLKAKTAYSSIVADLNIKYTSLASLKDSLPFLVLNLNLEDVRIKNSDVLYFNPKLIRQPFFQNKTNITTISGIVNGRVNKLHGNNMVIKTGNRTVIKTDFSITGLPDLETAYFIFPNLKINSGNRDILMMAGPSVSKTIGLPENIVMQVVFKGKVKSFESTIRMSSSFGSANLTVAIDENQNFKSNVSIANFNLGSLVKDTTMYGPITLTAKAEGQGLDKNTIRAKIDAEVLQVRLNKYNYRNLTADGNISGLGFEGKINLNDKNAAFDFDGVVNLNPGHEQYKFRLNVSGADLRKLNLAKDDIRIGFAAAADLKGGTAGKLTGMAEISNLVVAKEDKIYKVDSLLFASINETGKSEPDLNNFLIGIRYSGTISPGYLPAELSNFINNYFPFSDSNQVAKKSAPSDFNFEIHLRNNSIFANVLLPQLKEFGPGIIRGGFDSGKHDLKVNVVLKKIVYGTTGINDLVLNIDSDPSALNYKISGSSISNAQIKLDNFLLEGRLADKTIFANVSSTDGDKNKKLLIRLKITRKKANYRLEVDPKEFYLANNRWDIATDNYIEYGKEGLLIHHFFINHGESQINIASVHDRFNDDLNIEIRNFNLDDISRIIEKDISLVKGNVEGNLLLKRVNNSYGIVADAKISKLAVRGIPVGDLSVKADNPSAGRFDIDVNLSGTNNNLTAKGYYMPGGSDHDLSINAAIQSLSMKTVEAFSMGQITEASGMVTGNLFIRGAANAPDITGELVFNDAFINPAFLNTRLELKHETIQLKKNEIYFKSFTLRDAVKNTAIIDGTVQMKHYKDFVFDLHVTSKDFLLFNTTVKDNKEFFGRMIIDSKIDIGGPLTLPVVIAKIKVKKGSNFTFAVSEEKLTTDKGEGVVEFIDSLKLNSILYKEEKNAKQKSRFTGIDLFSVIEIDKQATLRLLMDPASSDSLVVRGEAALSFTMDRSGKTSLTGVYNLNEGSYLVSFQSVIKRKFDINPGSTIIWNGAPLDAEISINATYSVRASPIDLMANQVSGISEVDKSAYKQTYPFLVLLKLRGAILHPEISFEIQLPPKSKGILGGAVNAKLNLLNDDPSALNKQVFALLVLGRFVQENPLQTDANGGASNVFRSTVGNFLSAQLNKLGSKFVPGVELNFDIQSYDDYSTGRVQGRTQVGIGIKKQLFNERISVQVGGTVDVEGTKATQNSTSDITSDVTLEYKLSKEGRYRLKGFRNNLYEGAIEGQIIETGVGVSYVRDFNKWKELFRAPAKKKVIDPEKQK